MLANRAPSLTDFWFGRPKHALDDWQQFCAVVAQANRDESVNVDRCEQTIHRLGSFFEKS